MPRAIAGRDVIRRDILKPIFKPESDRRDDTMPPIDSLLIASSTILVLAGFMMEAAAVRAYIRTERTVMLPLAIGFALIVAATLATVAVVFVSDYGNYRLLLFVQNGVAMIGYLFVVYSVVFYQD